MKVPRSFGQYDDKSRENDPGGVLSAAQSGKRRRSKLGTIPDEM
jgi:hypothetical protein